MSYLFSFFPWAEPDPGPCVGGPFSAHPLVPGAGVGALVPALVPGAGVGGLDVPPVLVPGGGSLLWSPGKGRSGRLSGDPVPVSSGAWSGAWAKSNLNFLAFATGMSSWSSWPT